MLVPLHDRLHTRRESGLFSPVFVLSLGTSGCSFHPGSLAAPAPPPGRGGTWRHPLLQLCPPKLGSSQSSSCYYTRQEQASCCPQDCCRAKIVFFCDNSRNYFDKCSSRRRAERFKHQAGPKQLADILASSIDYFGHLPLGKKSFQQASRLVHPLAGRHTKRRPARAAGEKREDHWGLLVFT